MTIKDRGCPIPDPGDPALRAICLPHTWLGLVGELLVPPTKLDFWDRTATLADREAAMQIAETILGLYGSPDCTCTPACTPGSVIWDFTIDEQGWTFDTYGEYQAGVGWHATVVDETDGRHVRLDISTAIAGRPSLLGIPRFEYRVWGFPGERAPIRYVLYGYLNNVTVAEHENVWNEAAHTTSLNVVGRAEWYSEAAANDMDRLEIVVDVGPFNMALMTDVQFWVNRVYMEFCT